MNINKVIEVLQNTQPSHYANEDRFAYYDKVNNEFLFFYQQDEYELEVNEHYPNKLELLLARSNRVKRLYECRKDETKRFIYIKNPVSSNQLIRAYIDSYHKDKNIYPKLMRAFSGYKRKVRFKKTLLDLNLKDDYEKFAYESLKNISVKWCLKNNIEHEKN
ncbi:MAG: hypothetical protein ACI4U5_02610 [Bacilli bacterium]